MSKTKNWIYDCFGEDVDLEELSIIQERKVGNGKV